MAKSSFQKQKLLWVMDILLHQSDEDHPVTMPQLISGLERRGIKAERKSIYDDLQALRDWGLDIESAGTGRSAGYYVASRDFELPELKLLVDSVQSSKFITQRKTLSLIKKIEGLASVHQARELQRQVYVKNRIKTMNESIYYNVDELHRAIAEDRQIRFHYFEYTVDKERRFRRDGAWYVISPFALSWDDENYYLVGYDSAAGILKHFRVDKMTDIGLTADRRDGQETYAAMDMGVYARKTFGMFGGEDAAVKLRFENELVGPVLDRLGREAMLIPDGDRHFTVTTEVAVSPQFFAWVLGFGSRARLLGPDHVVDRLRRHIAEAAELYGD